MSLDRLDRSRAAAGDAADHVVGMSANGASRELGRVRKTRRHPVAVRVDGLDHGILRSLDSFDQIVAPLPHAVQQVLADRSEAVVDVPDAGEDVADGLLAGVSEALGKAFAYAGDRHAHPRAFRDDALERRRAGAVQGKGDVVRGGAERRGKPLARISDALAQICAVGIEVLGDSVVGDRDRVADPRSAGHDRLALIGHFGDQQANFALVVGIGAFEGRNLRPHARLELGGARKRAFDAVAHRSKLATDRLRQVRHMLARHRLGLGQPHRHLGNRPR